MSMVCGRLTRRMLTRRRTRQVCRDGGPKYLSSSPRGEFRSAKPHQDHPLGPQLFRTLRLQTSQLYRKRPVMVAIRLFLDVAATLVRCSRACDASFRCQRQLHGLVMHRDTCCTPHQLIHFHKTVAIQLRGGDIIIQEAGGL